VVLPPYSHLQTESYWFAHLKEIAHTPLTICIYGYEAYHESCHQKMTLPSMETGQQLM